MTRHTRKRVAGFLFECLCESSRSNLPTMRGLLRLRFVYLRLLARSAQRERARNDIGL